MSTDTVIATRGLSKRYGSTLAVDGLDLDVRRGEIYGFLGRNGAGKTTTIRMLLGLIRPSAGAVTIAGETIAAGTTRVFSRVGYLVESATAYPNLTVRENLEIQRRLTGARPEAADSAIELLRLGEYAQRRAGQLSLGNKQRLSIARALLHEPDVLILDEPANALDPAGIVEIRRLLRSLADERGVTVFMSSHILAEVAHLADRVGIVHTGRLLEEHDRDELAARAQPFVRVLTSDLTRTRTLLGEAGYRDVRDASDDEALDVYGTTEEHAAEIARLIVGAGLDLAELSPRHEDLESYFLRLTGGDS